MRKLLAILAAVGACTPFTLADVAGDAGLVVGAAGADASAGDAQAPTGDGGATTSDDAGPCTLLCDDFEGSSVDTSKWTFDVPDPDDGLVTIRIDKVDGHAPSRSSLAVVAASPTVTTNRSVEHDFSPRPMATVITVWLKINPLPQDFAQLISVYLAKGNYGSNGSHGTTKVFVAYDGTGQGLELFAQFLPDDGDENIIDHSTVQSEDPAIAWAADAPFRRVDLTVDCANALATLAVEGVEQTLDIGGFPHPSVFGLTLGFDYLPDDVQSVSALYDDLAVR